MKKHLFIYCIILAPIIFAISGCVSKGKFLLSESQRRRLEKDSANISQKLEACRVQVNNLEGDKSRLETDKSAMQNDLENISNKSNMTIAQQAKRLKDLENLIQAQHNAMNKLKKSITDALVNFKPDELSVYIKDGNVYVSLQEKLLFKSGSAVVDPKGKEALGTLASVLNNTPDVNVLIEGHTDTIPIKNERFQDNWALSVGRATSIVRILTKDYDLDPHRISASGRGEFHPVKPNDSDEGRTSNRRTEIILSPNLTDLYELLDR